MVKDKKGMMPPSQSPRFYTASQAKREALVAEEMRRWREARYADMLDSNTKSLICKVASGPEFRLCHLPGEGPNTVSVDMYANNMNALYSGLKRMVMKMEG